MAELALDLVMARPIGFKRGLAIHEFADSEFGASMYQSVS
jgi:hypothetical protein